MKDIQTLLGELTVEEKAALLEGYQSWMTNAVPRLDIPSVYLTDGPVGVRKKVQSEANGAIGLGTAYPATAFPTSVAIANSWDTENARRMGRAIGEECVHYDVDVLLAPAMNIKRDPRCGRNFEYYSEDPVLAGKMAAAFTDGVQSTGTAACPKHFALNNCENYRYMSDSVVDERAAREIYLKAFEICVKESRPRTMMCAYNKVNGTHCSQSKRLVRDVLRGEWGFDGMMMTDWGATLDRVAGVRVGMDLDMPGNVWENRRSIVDAVKNGLLSKDDLDRAVANVLKLVQDSQSGKIEVPEEGDLFAANHRLAVELAADSAVLLKNNGFLPLTGSERLLVVGELFEKPRFQGAGSSGMNPTQIVSPKDAFDRAGIAYTYLPGYHTDSADPDDVWAEQAVSAAAKADVILFFGGLTDDFESEGYDRKDLCIPACQLGLIDRLARSNAKLAAVLFGGSAFDLPFDDKVDAILHMFLPGQGGGEACRQLLYGEVNPSGKLSETWMRSVADIPFGNEFGKHRTIPYWENIFVGYRYYDLRPEKIRYPFGHGLSYTTFDYSDLSVEVGDERVTVSLAVTNTGTRDGAEVVQLYIGSNANSQVFKAPKALKAFQKVRLAAGEQQRVSFSIPCSDMAYYNTRYHKWVLENGDYPVLVGASSRDIRLQSLLQIRGQEAVAGQYSEEVVRSYRHIGSGYITPAVFQATIGRAMPPEPSARPFTMETPISEFQATRAGKLLFKGVMHVLASQGKELEQLPDGPEKDAQLRAHAFTMNYMPGCSPRGMVQSGGGRIQMNVGRAMPLLANGYIIPALCMALKKEKEIPLPINSEK
ncbi:MAG: hypothetical protein E7469_06305 [Ruminococcaceae bacterium]|nr:hypothetical protein [Oscillospiraceae bacterium]